jgi:glycosyltransferase involved in cell wall biosynthesis
MSNANQTISLGYLCLEAPREGQASYVHSTEIVKGLEERGFDIDYVAPDHGWPRPSVWRRTLKSLAIQSDFVRRLRNFHVVYIRAHPLAFPTVLACRVQSVPVIQEINGTFLDVYLPYPRMRRIRGLFEYVMRKQYAWADGLIVVTPSLADWLRDLLDGDLPPTKVITNAANTELFNPDRKTDLDLPQRFAVFVGSQTAWHDRDVLIAALDDPAWPKDVSLVLVGECGNAEDVQAALATHPNLVVTGRIPYNDVGGVLAKAMAVIVAIADPDGRSRSVGVAPIKLFEAIASGAPVIANDLPFQTEIMRETGAGLTFKTGDAAGLANAVSEVAANEEHYRVRSRAAAATIGNEHSWQKRAEQTHIFLLDVLTGE